MLRYDKEALDYFQMHSMEKDIPIAGACSPLLPPFRKNINPQPINHCKLLISSSLFNIEYSPFKLGSSVFTRTFHNVKGYKFNSTSSVGMIALLVQSRFQ